MKAALRLISRKVSQQQSLVRCPGTLTLTPTSPSPCWSFTQLRDVRVSAIDVRPGNVIEKSGRIYEVVDVGHRQRGRGGAMMQMEVRDVDSGNKTSLRFGPEDSVEKIFVEEKHFTCLYTEQDHAFIIEPTTYEQLEVPLKLFGKAAAYLTADMKVRIHLFDGRPLSASVPKRVTCTIKETQVNSKGTTVTPRYKKALLDNGLTVQVPPYLEAGEEIFINTEDDSFMSR
ncbi:hypothetical protein ACFE04_004815 [Oxalis oulophora]